jgi:P-type Cu+ transporter
MSVEQPGEEFKEIVQNNRSRVETAKSTDPVCGMEVESGRSKGGNATYEGGTYDFCSDECRDAFQANPRAYVARH